MPTTFAISVHEHPYLSLAGMAVRTDMHTAPVDCPRIWETFMARASEVTGKNLAGFQGASYGVSLMIDGQSGVFDYVASMPMPVEQSVPQGMRRIEIPAGLYAVCRVPYLEQMARPIRLCAWSGQCSRLPIHST